jgi:hypothetical protein
MPDIMITCPIFKKPIPTGLNSEQIILDSLEFELTVRCPVCRKIHKWKRADAWVADPGGDR